MPEPKQFEGLSPLDFDRYPVWVACHTADSRSPGTAKPTKKRFDLGQQDFP